MKKIAVTILLLMLSTTVYAEDHNNNNNSGGGSFIIPIEEEEPVEEGISCSISSNGESAFIVWTLFCLGLLYVVRRKKRQ